MTSTFNNTFIMYYLKISATETKADTVYSLSVTGPAETADWFGPAREQITFTNPHKSDLDKVIRTDKWGRSWVFDLRTQWAYLATAKHPFIQFEKLLNLYAPNGQSFELVGFSEIFGKLDGETFKRYSAEDEPEDTREFLKLPENWFKLMKTRAKEYYFTVPGTNPESLSNAVAARIEVVAKDIPVEFHRKITLCLAIKVDGKLLFPDYRLSEIYHV